MMLYHYTIAAIIVSWSFWYFDSINFSHDHFVFCFSISGCVSLIILGNLSSFIILWRYVIKSWFLWFPLFLFCESCLILLDIKHNRSFGCPRCVLISIKLMTVCQLILIVFMIRLDTVIWSQINVFNNIFSEILWIIKEERVLRFVIVKHVFEAKGFTITHSHIITLCYRFKIIKKMYKFIILLVCKKGENRDTIC